MNELTPPLHAGDHVLGNAYAPVTLVEYGDYQCPFCGRAHWIVGQLLAEFGGMVRYAFRHFPQTRLHPFAQMAAEAAQAAGAQGRFWAMHDTLFKHQAALEPADILSYAASLALDEERFLRELECDVHVPKIKADFRGGTLSGVQGTPAFFLDGARWEHGWDLPALKAGIASRQQHNAAHTAQG